MIRLVILASGGGTNAENIIRYFSGHSLIGVVSVISNHPEAQVLNKAQRHQVPVMVFHNPIWDDPAVILEYLDIVQADYLILAGFLRRIHPEIISRFPNKILNIHPALLPKHGGKGMYGEKVHQAVLHDHDARSGITIHLVNEQYDEGKRLFQAECPVYPDDTIQTLAKRVHELEYRHYPKVIEQYIFPSTKSM
jgi:phosphoribosylglycinamide formyltransferase 1